MENFFKLKEHNTTVKTEVIAGITTFVTMAYILVVNPQILSAPFEGEMAGKIYDGVFFATCIAFFAFTLIIGIRMSYLAYVKRL